MRPHNPPSREKRQRMQYFLSISFLSVFTSYMAIQNIQGSLNDEGSLGVISLGVLYGASILSGILAPLIVTQLGVKRVIIFFRTFNLHSVQLLPLLRYPHSFLHTHRTCNGSLVVVSRDLHDSVCSFVFAADWYSNVCLAQQV